MPIFVQVLIGVPLALVGFLVVLSADGELLIDDELFDASQIENSQESICRTQVELYAAQRQMELIRFELECRRYVEQVRLQLSAELGYELPSRDMF